MSANVEGAALCLELLGTSSANFHRPFANIDANSSYTVHDVHDDGYFDGDG